MRFISSVFLLLSCVIKLVVCMNIPKSNEVQFRYDYKYNEDVDGLFKFHEIPAKWHEAHDRCKLEGAELATPTNISILSGMISEIRGTTFSVYTGIHSIFSHGDFYSINGIPLDELPVTWAPNAPSGDYAKRCIVLHQNGTISNDDCDNAYYPFICYKNKDLKPINECGTTDDKYIYIDTSNACYKFHPQHKTWNDAFSTCSAEGGHMVVVNNEKELKALDFLFRQYSPSSIISNGVNNILIGIIDWSKSGDWVTIHGEKLNEMKFSIWGPGEPNNEGYNEYCGALIDLSKWNDVPCDFKRPFVCKKKLDSLLSKNNASTMT